MSSINIYHFSKEDLIRELYGHSSFLEKVKKYVKIKNPNMTDSQAESAAIEIIYQDCMKSFQYSDSVRSASDALRRVSNSKSPLSQMVDKEIRSAENKQKAEEQRIARLREFCQKEGLDFEKENKNYLERSKRWEKIWMPIFWSFGILWIVNLLVNFFTDFERGTTPHTIPPMMRVLRLSLT